MKGFGLRLAIGWAVLGGAMARGQAHAAALAQSAYVWQRVWSAALEHDVAEHAAAFTRLDVLAAEITFPGSNPEIEYTAPAWERLRATGVHVACVIRVGARPSGHPWRPAEVETVTRVIRRVIASAREHGVGPVEVQLDYDAATASLGDYRGVLERVRAAVQPLPLTFTILPTWMGSAQFPALAAAADGFILQVHSLEKPRTVDAPVVLFDGAKAREWIRQAAGFGRPFRVALPTYGYRVGFAADGHFLGLEAEGAPRSWPAGTTVRVAWADAAEVAKLVEELQRARPANCTGVSWFRFPCRADELAWRWVTLQTAMSGARTHADFGVRLEASSDGSVAVVLANGGTDRAAVRACEVHWPTGGLVALDAIGDWRARRDGAASVVFEPVGASDLAPGDRVTVGWIRLRTAATPVGARVL